MPYKSDAQRRYLHAKHPGIAAKWDAEIRSKKKRVKKDAGKSGWLKPLLVGTAAGTLANQAPSIEEIRRNRKRGAASKKGKVTKAYTPVTDDPYFNHEAAEKAFNLVMKMDDDTAEMFVHIVASDLLEREVEENRETLQKHLDEVIAKRLDDLTKATARAFAKGADVDPFVAALDLIADRISKASADDTAHNPAYIFERQHPRGQSGRFRSKIDNAPVGKRPIPDDVWANLGHAGPGKTLGNDAKARWQNQYLQLAEHLDTVNAATAGAHETLIHYKNDKTGDTYTHLHGDPKPPAKELAAPNVRAIGIESVPLGLTAGGAAFSLAGAMGHGMSARQVAGVNTVDANAEAWKTSWLDADNAGSQSNARLYARTKTLGEAATTLGPGGSKVQLAGKMAEIVGQYGPQAEEVLGPSARKTAYRYRGTEKTPDKRLVDMYGEAIEHNKKLGGIDPWAERDENRLRRARGAGKQPFGTETGVRIQGQPRPKGEPPKTLSLHQMVAEREARANRAPDWQERELGRQAVTQYLTDKLPSKQNYKLQLAAGNTPPSEGVIINSNGQIVTQAVGYGDDHYLPFNLKNLKGLKGGEYVRNRSVGGLTAEDVYTGLISGARRVTVVSRSGTFTMEFQPDFRGGRRHNDKARRMTRRYEQILDAVQSEQVERQDVPTRWKKIIENEVRGEYGPKASPRLLRAEIDNRIKEFKANPQIDGRDLDRAESDISRMEDRERLGEVSRQDVADYRQEVMGELRDLKEIHFRLNGVGYTAALDSLEEQFPYYIKAAGRPKQEHLTEHEQDMGYVEPARNRPTEAQAGWFGTAARGKSGSEARGGKFSAAYADYQRGLPGAPPPPRAPRAIATSTTATDTTSTGSTGGGSSYRSERDVARDKVAEAVAVGQAQERIKNTAVALQQQVKGIEPPKDKPRPEWWDMDDTDMRAYLEDDDNLKKFHTDVAGISDWSRSGAERHLAEYLNATKKTTGKDYSKSMAKVWPTAPYKFPNESHEGYRPSAEPAAVEGAIREIDDQDASLKFDKPLSELNPKQLREEFELSKTVANAADTAKKSGLSGDEALLALSGQLSNPGSGYASRFFADGGAERHLENIHKMHHLTSKKGGGTGGGTAGLGGSAGFGGGGSTGGAGAGSSTPTGPSGGHLEPVSTEDDMRNDAQSTIHHYAQTARKMARVAEQRGDQNAMAKYEDFASNVANLTPDQDGMEKLAAEQETFLRADEDLAIPMMGQIQQGGTLARSRR